MSLSSPSLAVNAYYSSHPKVELNSPSLESRMGLINASGQQDTAKVTFWGFQDSVTTSLEASAWIFWSLALEMLPLKRIRLPLCEETKLPGERTWRCFGEQSQPSSQPTASHVWESPPAWTAKLSDDSRPSIHVDPIQETPRLRTSQLSPLHSWAEFRRQDINERKVKGISAEGQG